ncbi:hypothetical protein DZF91_19085 [Actinomadura logoneensis]|uniref:Uncharacterized protein n=1 Tax=Actinomadura logoneensis TaxID=2293572 RepID=A0A372JJG5_9ACTN|nr:hypothetical protein [Actinomadura logoneensis]RFU40069.1 hypothetical protein DZF91_19085 [Actinomadura logoneensis]
MRKAPIDTSQFIRLFLGRHVRAQLSPDLLGDPERGVEERFSTSRDVLGDLLTVWYATASGHQTEWNHPEAVTHTVRQASDVLKRWDRERRDTLDRLVRCFRAQDEPVQLVLPALALDDGRALILDGTHRAVAAYHAGVPVTALVYALRAPLSARMLPDLTHHLPRPGTPGGTL